LPSAPAAAWLFARFVVPVIAASSALGAAAFLLLIAPFGTIQAAVVIAIPCLVVRMRRAEY